MNANDFGFSLEDRTFIAMQGLVEGLLTNGDTEYMKRRIDECIAIMGEHGWQTPTNANNLDTNLKLC